MFLRIDSISFQKKKLHAMVGVKSKIFLQKLSNYD